MQKLFFTICLTLSLLHHAQAEEIKVEVLAKSGKSWDGATLPNYPQGEPEMTIVKVTLPPRSQTPVHKHPFILGGIVLKGELTVITEENKTMHFKTGDAVLEVVNTWHQGNNDTDETVEILVFYVGIKGEPVSINK
ncbi:MAG: cupin domain-containing protein [Gammaproteobacteria bacterium]